MKNNCQKKKENKIEIRYVIVTCCLFIWDVVHLRWVKQLGFFLRKKLMRGNFTLLMIITLMYLLQGLNNK